VIGREIFVSSIIYIFGLGFHLYVSTMGYLTLVLATLYLFFPIYSILSYTLLCQLRFTPLMQLLLFLVAKYRRFVNKRRGESFTIFHSSFDYSLFLSHLPSVQRSKHRRTYTYVKETSESHRTLSPNFLRLRRLPSDISNSEK